mmetsp:Transcript_27426/g.84176  ORF Transcript_27426/g.84176 Transcript_27426/m.84176 type:complete len:210 (-) Transcript_27426:718-1347(-)
MSLLLPTTPPTPPKQLLQYLPTTPSPTPTMLATPPTPPNLLQLLPTTPSPTTTMLTTPPTPPNQLRPMLLPTEPFLPMHLPPPIRLPTLSPTTPLLLVTMTPRRRRTFRRLSSSLLVAVLGVLSGALPISYSFFDSSIRCLRTFLFMMPACLPAWLAARRTTIRHDDNGSMLLTFVAPRKRRRTWRGRSRGRRGGGRRGRGPSNPRCSG